MFARYGKVCLYILGANQARAKNFGSWKHLLLRHKNYQQMVACIEIGCCKMGSPPMNFGRWQQQHQTILTSLNQRANYLHFAWDKPNKPWALLLVLPPLGPFGIQSQRSNHPIPSLPGCATPPWSCESFSKTSWICWACESRSAHGAAEANRSKTKANQY